MSPTENAQELYLSKVLWMEKEQEDILKSSIPQNLDLHIWIETFCFAGTARFFLWHYYRDITLLTLGEARAETSPIPSHGWS